MSIKEKEVIAWLSERKLMPSPELVTHVVNHPEGLVLLEKSVDLLDTPKLFLSVSDLLVDETPEPPKPVSRPKVADIPKPGSKTYGRLSHKTRLPCSAIGLVANTNTQYWPTICSVDLKLRAK